MFRKKCGCPKAAWDRCEHHWTAAFKVRGAKREVSTGTADRDAAVVEASRRKLELRRAAGLDLGHRCRLSQLAAAHVAEKSKERVTDARVRVVEYHWAPVLAHFTPDFDPARLTFEQLEDYRDTRREVVRGQTIERELWCLKEGLRIGKRRGWLRSYPVDLEDWPPVGHDEKDESRAGKLHPPEVLAAVLAECDDDLRERIEFDARTGLRKHELMRVEFSWVEKAPKKYAHPALLTVPSVGAKTRKPRIVPLPKEAVAILERRFAQASVLCALARLGGAAVEPSSWLAFPGDRKKALYSAIEAAQMKAVERYEQSGAERRGYFNNITLRDMRHAYLTAGEFVTKDRKAAADVAGHARLKTTEIYLHSDMQRLADFASAAGGWFGGVDGKGWKGKKSLSDDLRQQLYFTGKELVGTPGIEPGTPTVSSDSRRGKPNKVTDPTGHGGHGRSGTSTPEGWKRGVDGRRRKSGPR